MLSSELNPFGTSDGSGSVGRLSGLQIVAPKVRLVSFMADSTNVSFGESVRLHGRSAS